MKDFHVFNVADSQRDDEYYTPAYAITPILKYISPTSPDKKVKIWCPFDTEESNFVRVFREYGYEVIATHIDNGVDFFTAKQPECDYIISNPPYSRKIEVIGRCFHLCVPFAMLVGASGLFGSKKKFDMFRANDFELVYFNGRIDYRKTNQKSRSSAPFDSVYVCSGVLPKQIVFEEIKKNSFNI